ncbi:MAG: hypothetical protein QOH37_697 [Nocardioidaceae bacterium]|jgi:hypothetical protein|nr:hypothetical protein [Nocardioidaceae bacterium]
MDGREGFTFVIRTRVPDRREVCTVPDQFDVSLEDADLLGEVELTTNLIIAASETDEHLSDAEIDEILGVEPQRSA